MPGYAHGSANPEGQQIQKHMEIQKGSRSRRAANPEGQQIQDVEIQKGSRYVGWSADPEGQQICWLVSRYVAFVLGNH